MAKYVSETAGGKSVSAYVIMKGARHVATVNAYFGPGGSVLVNVFNVGDKAAQRCCIARKKPWPPTERGDGLFFQSGRAGGYGYDKFAAALSGTIIDGHEISDHCARSIKPPKGHTLFPEGFKPPKGYRLANWRGSNESDKERGYMSCYRMSGLDYLRELGYQVINAI